MQVIQAKLTQPNYADELTIAPFGWEAIEVSIGNAACLAQIIDRHGGSLDEVLVQPGTLNLRRVGGCRFRTNPSTPGLAALIDAFAYLPGEPILSGLKPRDVLQTGFGPSVFENTVVLNNLGPSKPLFRSPVPPNWASLLLSITGDAAQAFELELSWEKEGITTQFFDFYLANLNASPGATVALPILGDTVIAAGSISGLGAVELVLKGCLTSFPPYSVWQLIPSSPLFWTLTQAVGAGATVTFDLPFYFGPASISCNLSAGGPYTVQVEGRDHAGNRTSLPYLAIGVAAGTNLRDSLTLSPHRNRITVTNNGGVAGTVNNLQVNGP